MPRMRWARQEMSGRRTCCVLWRKIQRPPYGKPRSGRCRGS